MQFQGFTFTRLIAFALCVTLASPLPLAAAQQQTTTPPPAAAQQPPAPTTAPTTTSDTGLGRRLPPGGIRILVLEGQNVLNSIQTRSAVSPVVQVLDSLDQPVAGATVTFEVSPTGPGGSFGLPPAPVSPMVTVRTDYVGQATAHFTPNGTAGRFSIRVKASIEGQSAGAAILQTNDPTIGMAGISIPKKHWYQSWKWWAIIGGAATVGIILLTRSSGGDPTITISPAPVDIGGPR